MANNSQGGDTSDPEHFPFRAAFTDLSLAKDKGDFLRVPEGGPCLECLFSWPIDEYIVSREINFCHSGGLRRKCAAKGREHDGRCGSFQLPVQRVKLRETGSCNETGFYAEAHDSALPSPFERSCRAFPAAWMARKRPFATTCRTPTYRLGRATGAEVLILDGARRGRLRVQVTHSSCGEKA